MKSNVYTRIGDSGTTSLVGGTRVSKADARLEAYGTIDEANSWVGVLHASDALPYRQREVLSEVMSRMFDIGSTLATEAESKWQPAPFPVEAVQRLEEEIDALDATLPVHNRFVLPSGHPDAARANVARTVVRRAERRIIALEATGVSIDPTLLRFVNRLSDYLFVLSRAINKQTGHDEVFWESPRQK